MIIKLILLFLFTLNGFGILGVTNIIVLGTFVLFVNNGFLKPNPYRNTIIFIFIGVFLSFIPASLYRGQNLLQTFRASSGYLYLITFYAILKLRPSAKDTEKAMLYLSLIASLIYIIQYYLLPLGIQIIQVSEEYIEGTTDDYVDRFRMIGTSIFSLGYFYALSKYILTNKLKYAAIAFINLLPNILLAFRTNLAGIALFSVILLFKMTNGRVKKISKYVLLAGIVVVIALQIPAVSDRVDYIIEKQQDGTESFANDGYIRWVTFAYYVNEFPEGILDRVFGSGSATSESDFGKYTESLRDRGMHWVDWGLVGLTWTIGPFTVLAMIWLNIICCKLVPNKNYLYITIWFVYLITISLVTSQDYFLHGGFIIQSIALYIGYKAYLENKQDLRIKSNNKRFI